MPNGFLFFLFFLALLWFLFYWIFGGVFFAALALSRLMRLRKVRFSCLFSFAALACAIGASWTGLKLAEDSIATCSTSFDKGEGFLRVISCGFVGILTGMLVWAIVLGASGFLFLAFSKRREASWLTRTEKLLESDDDEPPLN
jgi:hypothetical protein